MKLSDQVITLEQAKKLQQLGFKKESYFTYYRGFIENPEGIAEQKKYFREVDTDKIPAYTVSELMDYLPSEFENMLLRVQKFESKYRASYAAPGYSFAESTRESMAEDLGDMLIDLIVREYITS